MNILFIAFTCWLLNDNLPGAVRAYLYSMIIVAIFLAINGQELIGSGYFWAYFVEVLGVFVFIGLLSVIGFFHLGQFVAYLHKLITKGRLIK
tara:strand:+ start:144 stop:419 length:276 start_codon:yes stop_codon:yes gene_type:complete